MELKQSNKYEVQVPRDEKFIQIPVHKWESLKFEVDRIDRIDPILPGFIGVLMGFWLSTLVFARPSLVPDLYWAFSVLWILSVVAYLVLYKMQRALVGRVKDELKEIISDVDK